MIWLIFYHLYLKWLQVSIAIHWHLRMATSFPQGAFQTFFPELFDYYAASFKFLRDDIGNIPDWSYPFCGMCINVGEVICKPHRDVLNYRPGPCCIIPFGTLYSNTDCRVGVDELGLEFELAAGIPLYILSAIFRHYNTPKVSKNTMRGSIVIWTGGSIFQYCDLRGRTIGDLNKSEYENYCRMKGYRIRTAVDRFPGKIWLCSRFYSNKCHSSCHNKLKST